MQYPKFINKIKKYMGDDVYNQITWDNYRFQTAAKDPVGREWIIQWRAFPFGPQNKKDWTCHTLEYGEVDCIRIFRPRDDSGGGVPLTMENPTKLVNFFNRKYKFKAGDLIRIKEDRRYRKHPHGNLVGKAGIITQVLCIANREYGVLLGDAQIVVKEKFLDRIID